MVGQDHQLLDQGVGHGVGAFLVDALDASVVVRLEPEVAPIQHHGAAVDAQFSPCPGDGRQGLDVREHLGSDVRGNLHTGILTCLERQVHLVVVQPASRSNDRAAHHGRLHVGEQAALHVQREEDRHGKAIPVREQGAQVLAQPARQHGVDSADKVHCRGSLPGQTVDWVARPHEVRDIRHVHAHAEGPLDLPRFDGDCVVQILGGRGIDGDAPNLSEVRAAQGQLLPDHIGAVRKSFAQGSLDHLGEGPPVEAVEGEQGVGLGGDGARRTEHLDHLGPRGQRGAGPICELDNTEEAPGLAAVLQCPEKGSLRQAPHTRLLGCELRPQVPQVSLLLARFAAVTGHTAC
mmetsp:Transcript_99088/g.317872  ORF Transcript_99088/g.317872 Transcript_99088/m.317872 type:complete len:348 (+) Transcript_99088:1364-2407(+)